MGTAQTIRVVLLISFASIAFISLFIIPMLHALWPKPALGERLDRFILYLFAATMVAFLMALGLAFTLLVVGWLSWQAFALAGCYGAEHYIFLRVCRRRKIKHPITKTLI